jgi:hypothetical protein
MKDSLLLGVEMTLSKRPKAPVPDLRRFALPERVPIWKGIPLDVSYAERSFDYASRPVDPRQDVRLAGEGLNQLYVCFGAPGTGKSFLIKQLLKQMATGWDPAWGGLLLDPKQTLIDEIRGESGIPAERLHVIRPDNPRQRTNLLCGGTLGPRDLGVALALAAQSAGISSKEPFWLNDMKRIFGAGLQLLTVLDRKPTLHNLADLLLSRVKVKGTRRAALEGVIESAEGLSLDEKQARNRDRAISELEEYAESRGDNAQTVRSFISQVLSPFLDPELDYVSDESGTATSIAELIIRDGKWVVLEVPKSSLSVSRMLSALAKILFQRAALDRFASFPGNQRPIFLVVDEYAELASDLPGEGFGDSIFFSQARQFKVLSFIATQGIPMLENSGVREAWKTILSNSAGKIFFRVADPDTAELAAKLLGEGNLVVSDKSVTQSPEGGNVQRGEKLERRTILTSDLFTTALGRGQFVFLGVTDGGRAGLARIRYVDGDKRYFEEKAGNG